ncbi:MAG: ATP-binding protein [Candidatus Omnitrophota bacterium]
MEKKEIFKKIILEFHGTKINLIRRDLKLPVDTRKIVTLYGSRRCGKTYLFYQTIRDLLDKKVVPTQVIYINFEDERILPFAKEDWELLMDAYFELYPGNADKKIYLFLDEIQETPFWDKFTRRLSEKENFYIFLTGSSSKLFSREISTSLRGRTLSYFLIPFSFKEFIRAKGIELEANFEYSDVRHKIKKFFEEYVKFGGFPEIFDKEDSIKIQILQGYFDLIFFKDVVERYNIRNFNLMKELMRYLLANFSSLFSLTGYYNFLKSSGQKIGKDTLFEYMACLEEVNFIKQAPIFDFSLKKQMVNPKKNYCIDTGLITAVTAQFSENKGRYLENAAFLELLRRGKEVYYYKDKKSREVDFLITEKGKPSQLIQVAQNLKDDKVKQREVASLINAANQFDIKECLILTEDEKSEISEEKVRIKVLPLWYWLLT